MKKKTRDPRVYLEDILAAIARIEEYTAKGKEWFLKDGMTQDAVIRQISVIGEAASKLPSTLRSRYPSIPWKEMVGMRNILIHDYSAISIRRVWETVERDLPELRHAVRALLDDSPGKGRKGAPRKPAGRKKAA